MCTERGRGSVFRHVGTLNLLSGTTGLVAGITLAQEYGFLPNFTSMRTYACAGRYDLPRVSVELHKAQTRTRARVRMPSVGACLHARLLALPG